MLKRTLYNYVMPAILYGNKVCYFREIQIEILRIEKATLRAMCMQMSGLIETVD